MCGIEALSEENNLVIFIHGTFAPGAIWTRQNSPLFLEIQQSIPNSLVFPFGWSGKNNHKERLSASRELQVYIRHLNKLKPDAQIYLVAHSHGGNVALQALRDFKLQQLVKGLVCLATPYITISPRLTISSHIKGIGFASGSFLALLVVLLVDEKLGEFLEVVVGLLGIVLSVFSGVLIASFLRRVSIPQMRLIMSRLRPPLKISVPLLSISYKGDEAALWLRTVYLLMGANFVFADLFLMFFFLSFAALCFTLALALVPFIRYFLAPIAESIMEVVAPVFAVGLGLTAISWAAILGVSVSLFSRRWGYGGYLTGTSIFTKVSAKKTPQTKCPLFVVEGHAVEGMARIREKTGRRLWRLPGIVHSLAYQDPWAIKSITDWMLNRINEVKASNE